MAHAGNTICHRMMGEFDLIATRIITGQLADWLRREADKISIPANQHCLAESLMDGMSDKVPHRNLQQPVKNRQQTTHIGSRLITQGNTSACSGSSRRDKATEPLGLLI